MRIHRIIASIIYSALPREVKIFRWIKSPQNYTAVFFQNFFQSGSEYSIKSSSSRDDPTPLNESSSSDAAMNALSNKQ